MKKNFAKILGLVLLMLMFTVPVLAQTTDYDRPDDLWGSSEISTNYDFVAELLAGQYLHVGKVFILPQGLDADGYHNYLVTLEINDEYSDWYLQAIHFEAINDGELEAISNHGSFIPGKFTAKESFELPIIAPDTGDISGGTHEFSFWYKSPEPVVAFVVHAVVTQAIPTYDEVYNTWSLDWNSQTAWGCYYGGIIPNANWSRYFLNYFEN